jgi:asparagine synthase (glutamine-hydrolysing)
MLKKIAHRGHETPVLVQGENCTLGMIATTPGNVKFPPSFHGQVVWDGPQPPLPQETSLSSARGPFAIAAASSHGLFLARDLLGTCRLYFGRTSSGALCFSSEVKALLLAARQVSEFPPGHWMNADGDPHPFRTLQVESPLDLPEDVLAARLRLLLSESVLRRIDGQVMGSWLSGGLDSSAIAALARPHLKTLHTFAGGLDGAPDLAHASRAAEYLHTNHHEVIVSLTGMLKVLPQVIYHLESFDALLVRSTILNFLVAEAASHFVPSAFSGEGGDELFAGYDYLKDLPEDQIPAELVDITGRLHNTALQRVDRSASAHGLLIHVPLIDLDILDFALRLPPACKIHRNGKPVEKYILRLALQGSLPDDLLWRPKAKFWQGAGVETLLARHAEKTITRSDFNRQRTLPNGWTLNSREELLYYRIFKEHFGELEDLDWMGRTKGAPVS